MALNDQDRDYIHEAAVNAASEVSERIIERVLQWHIASCPHGKTLLAAKWSIIGACFCSALGGGGTVAILMKALL